jgi:hypothetical protein
MHKDLTSLYRVWYAVYGVSRPSRKEVIDMRGNKDLTADERDRIACARKLVEAVYTALPSGVGIAHTTDGDEVADYTDEQERCAYCGAAVLNEPTPQADDDAAWARIAGQHAVGCEWVETRAHTTPEDTRQGWLIGVSRAADGTYGLYDVRLGVAAYTTAASTAAATQDMLAEMVADGSMPYAVYVLDAVRDMEHGVAYLLARCALLHGSERVLQQ